MHPSMLGTLGVLEFRRQSTVVHYNIEGGRLFVFPLQRTVKIPFKGMGGDKITLNEAGCSCFRCSNWLEFFSNLRGVTMSGYAVRKSPGVEVGDDVGDVRSDVSEDHSLCGASLRGWLH